jgi:hypothetical protein
MSKAKDKAKKRSHTSKHKPSKQEKHRRRALQMARKSVEYQVRLAYAKVPFEAVELRAARLHAREELVTQGYLRIEELETLSRNDAMAQARKRLDNQVTTAKRRRLR